ncbi:MAG: hypothetical protein GX285_02805 [Clostridiales bacterium]|nr:hypothetical protein [Clostridiales bacterium]
MQFKISTIILSLLLVFVGFLLLITFNNYERDFKELSGRLKTSDTLHLEALNELTISYNELLADYDALYASYKQLDASLNKTEYEQFVITGYSANDPAQGTTNLVKAGFNLDYEHVKKLPIIAVDESIIPLYSIVEIKDLGIFLALDTGGAIKGNRIDVLFEDKQDAIEFGKKICDVRIIK